MLIGEIWTLYKSNVLVKNSEKPELSRWNNHLGPILNDFPLADLTALSILKLRKTLEDKGLSPQSVKHCLGLLHRLLHKAILWEIYPGPLPRFEMPKFDNRRMRFLSKNEARLLLGELKKRSPLWHDISLFALHTGLRANEIFSLTDADVNWNAQFVSVKDTKNHKNRMVPLNVIATEITQKYYHQAPTIFHGTDGQPLTCVSRVFKRSVDTCGLNHGVTDRRLKVVFHTLRHTFASWLAQNEKPIIIIGQLLGHSDLKMTMRYAHLSGKELKDAVNTLL